MQLPDLNEILQRGDEEVLQRLLGRPTVRLMQATLGRNLSLSTMRQALIEITPAPQLLSQSDDLRLILELLTPSELDFLSESVVGKKVPGDRLASMIKARTPTFDRLLDALSVQQPYIREQVAVQSSETACKPAWALFPHQLDAMQRVLGALRTHPHRVMLHMPTGSGKTRTAMHIAAQHFRDSGCTTIVWLATSEELCGQAAEEFERTWGYVGDREVRLQRAWGSHDISSSELDVSQPRFIVAGLAKLHALRRSDQILLPRLGDQVSLVIFDEAHQAIADTYQAVVNVLVARNPKTRLLGLTATPGRTWDNVSADAELSKYFGRNKVRLEVPGYPNSVAYLIDQGYLARPVFRNVPYHHTSPLTNEEATALAEALDVPEGIRTRLAQDDLRNLAIVRECQRLVNSHRRLLVFAATVQHSELIAVVLRGLGIAAYSVTGRTSSPERSRLVNWFRSSDEEPRVLVNFGILTTGFDAPATSAALIARPTRSLVLYSQMAGRALRGPRASGNANAEIVTVVDTSLPGFGDPAQAFSNWEDVW